MSIGISIVAYLLSLQGAAYATFSISLPGTMITNEACSSFYLQYAAAIAIPYSYIPFDTIESVSPD